ncbi:serine/threonine protein kinase [Trapelia coarctata]|nr:serine/threonine protein kinase [Trapelia coarctata]
MATNKPTESSSAGNQHEASFQVEPVDSEDGPSEQPTSAGGQPANSQNGTQEHAVRFNSVLQEIEPAHSLHTDATLSHEESKPEEPLSPEAQEEIRNLSQSLQQSHIQHRRMSNFAFEPVSLPVSRAPSNESSLRNQPREGRRSGAPSPRASPTISSMNTPPLTPAISSSRNGQHGSSAGLGSQPVPVQVDPMQMTPQTSGLRKTPPGSASEFLQASALASSRPGSSSGQISTQISTQPSSVSQASGVVDALSKHQPHFIVGPSGDSLPPSRDRSPPTTPGPGSGTVTPPAAYSRPFTPVGDSNDPYARSKRPPQSRNLDTIDARFIFGGRESRRSSAMSTAAGSMGPLPRSNSGNDLKSDKPQSGFSLHSLGAKKDHHAHLHEEGPLHKSHGSMSDLKRFLRIGHSKDKRSNSPARSTKASLNKSGARTPPNQFPSSNVPFADDHGLESKYGRFGKVLGSGAGGSVRLLKRSSDGVTFAVKQFRDRHSYETEREYNKKVTAEFCIGSTLHHGNIIETLDIIQEKGHWYEVMEFAPYDLFAIVMTGKMSREEIACSFLQIFAGVTYLHSMGLAHRDLKLDNVVVNEHGIMKLIDFGSAVVFRYPFENDIVLATGIVGSDPYLAPEVYDNNKYDPQPVDVWSLAIIFACMSLRRFPWKAPRISDNSYRLFISPPSPGTPPAEGALRRTSEQRPKSMMELSAAADEGGRSSAPQPEGSLRQSSGDGRHHHHHHNDQSGVSLPEQGAEAETSPTPKSPGARAEGANGKPEVIKGPWRLLRLLPRESRHIIGRMLEIDPKRRATIEEMLEDPWVANTPVCQQLEGGEVVKAPGHTHTLEPGTADTSATSKK